jgi:glutamate formiminotransferase
VGARPPLVAYNVWLERGDLAAAHAIATALRRPALRALGLQVGPRVQVSMNLVDPTTLGPDAAFDLVVDACRSVGATVAGAELVGLLPDAVLRAIPPERWADLDLAEDRTIEARVRR